MQVDKLKNISTYQEAIELTRIFNEAVRDTQKENSNFGLPNIYFMKGQIYFQLPNGDIVKQRP